MDEREDQDIVRWYLKLQEKSTREAINSEEYGLTNHERSFLRKLCGYEGGRAPYKSISSAGWYAREALKLESEIRSSKEDETQEDDVFGERMIKQGQLPSIFTQVYKSKEYLLLFLFGFVGLTGCGIDALC